jgi:hypothetical protein
MTDVGEVVCKRSTCIGGVQQAPPIPHEGPLISFVGINKRPSKRRPICRYIYPQGRRPRASVIYVRRNSGTVVSRLEGGDVALPTLISHYLSTRGRWRVLSQVARIIPGGSELCRDLRWGCVLASHQYLRTCENPDFSELCHGVSHPVFPPPSHYRAVRLACRY